MTVAFDALGPSPAGAVSTTASVSWTHTSGAGGGTVLAWLTVSTGSWGFSFTSVTCGGSAMTLLGSQEAGGAAVASGGIFCYGATGVAAGPVTISATCSVTPSDAITGFSESFTGGSGFGTAVTGADANTPSASGSVSAGTSPGGLVAAGLCTGAGGEAWTAGTQRFLLDRSFSTAAGNASGATSPSSGGTVTLSWTQSSDHYGVIAVEVLAAAASPVNPPVLAAQPGPAWRSRYQGAGRPRPQAFMPSAQPQSAAPSDADSSAAADGAEAAGVIDSDAGTAADAGESASVFTPPVNPPVLAAQPGPALRSRRLPRGAARPAHLVPAASAPPSPAVITGLAGGGTGYFADQYGRPRLVIGDAAWALCGNAGRWNSGNWQADFDGYCANRGAQGYTVIYGKPIGTVQSGNIDSNGATFDSLYPFQGASPTAGTAGANPSTGLTAAFWARIDYFLNSAQAQGITVFFNAIGYGSDFSGGPGPLAGKSSAEFTAYGTALGARYAGRLNLVWLLADDWFGGADDALITAFLTGVRGAGDTHPVSIENMAESDARFSFDATPSVLPWGTAHAQYNFCYSYNATYVGIEKAYLEASPLPVIQGDGYFYQSAGATYFAAQDRPMRQDCWWALSSGARGAVQGSEAIWQWPSTALAQSGTGWWYNNVGKIRAAFEGLNGWHLLIPDTSSQLVTGGRGTHAATFASGGAGGQYEPATTDAYVSASRVPDGSLAVIYLSHATTITVDQTKMAAGYTASWVDPVSGASSAGTPGSTYNSAAQGANSAGDPDWVLVLAAPPSVPVSDSDSGTAADAGERVSLASPDAGAASDAGPLTAGPSAADAGAALDAGERVSLASADASPGADAGEHVNTGGGSAVSDSDAVRAEDSGFAYPASAETAAGADAGEAVSVTGAEASPAADRETAAWPSSADASPAAEAQYWSGPLSSPGDPSPGADAGERVRVAGSDAASGSDQAPVVEIYTYQPPFRWTGGGYELVWHAAAGPGGFTGITVWRGPRPDGAVFRLFSVLALSDEVRLAHDADACPAADEADPVLASVTVTAGPALAVVVQAREG